MTIGDLIRLQIYMGKLDQAESFLKKVTSGDSSGLNDSHITADSERLLNAIEFNRKIRRSIAENNESVNKGGLKKIPIVGNWFIHWTPSGGMFIQGQTKIECERVLVYANDKLIKIIKSRRNNNSNEMRSFSIFLRFDLLRAFPEETVLAISADSGMLLHQTGSLYYRDDRITGSNTLFQKLAKGYFITHKGKLRLPVHKNAEWKSGVLSAYTEFVQHFKSAFNQTPFIVNTTLLGCLLKGDFLDEDDGFHVAYFSKNTSPDKVKEEMVAIILKLLQDGIDVSLSKERNLFKPRINDKKIAVYPLWCYRDKLYLLNRVVPGNGALINPLKHQLFQGIEVYLPNQADT
ncbi:MAG TPA: hypothetical protein VGL10_09440, partial [Gammaproteobacteria bacterium]